MAYFGAWLVALVFTQIVEIPHLQRWSLAPAEGRQSNESG